MVAQAVPAYALRPMARGLIKENIAVDAAGKILSVSDINGNVWEEYIYDTDDPSKLLYVKLRNIKTGGNNIQLLMYASANSLKRYVIYVNDEIEGFIDYEPAKHHLFKISVAGKNEGVGQTVINWFAKICYRENAIMDVSPIASPLISHLVRKFIYNPKIINPVNPLNVEYLVLDKDYGLLDSSDSHEIGTVGVYGGEIRKDFTYGLPDSVDPIVRNGRLVILDRATGKEKDVTLLYHYSRESIKGTPTPIFPIFIEDGAIEHWQFGDTQQPCRCYINNKVSPVIEAAA